MTLLPLTDLKKKPTNMITLNLSMCHFFERPSDLIT